MSALESVTGVQWWHEVPIRHPASVTGPACVDCDTRLSTPRVECAPGVNYCVYCADTQRHAIITDYPGARVVFGDMTFHLANGGDQKE